MEQMSLISKKKGERIDKFLGRIWADLFPFLYRRNFLKDGLILVEWEKKVRSKL